METKDTVQKETGEASTAAAARAAATGLAAPSQDLMGIPPAQKRKKSAGEVAFDLTTYGGVSLLGNEALGMAITKQTETGFLRGAFRKTQQIAEKLPLLNKLPYVHERSPFLLWATVSGTLLVLPVKMLEDNKGKLVRLFDRIVRGKNAENDPDLAARHNEMENAPRQTWASLGEGRVITVASALLVDAFIGWPKAVITKLFDKPGKPNDLASFDRISTTLARQFVRHNLESKATLTAEQYGVLKQITAREAITDLSRIGERYSTKGEGAVAMLSLAGTLLTLSTALTALFYVSSKAFARGKEAKQQQPTALPAASPSKVRLDESGLPSVEQAPSEGQEKPGTRVAQVENISRVATPTLLQAGV